MGYLAFDPLRVTALDREMRHALDELWLLGCGDPLAVDAVGEVRDARVRLTDIWLPLVDRINRCDALVSIFGIPLHPGDLIDIVMETMVAEHGWLFADAFSLLGPPDTGAPWGAPSIAEVEVLAEQLDTGDLATLTDTARERRWLAAQLDLIAANPVLAASFAAGFTHWTELIGRLGTERMEIAGDKSAYAVRDHTNDADAIASVDAVEGAIVRAFASIPGAATLPSLDDLTPYSAAALVAQAQLPPEALADVSFALLGRLIDDRPIEGWWEDRWSGPSSADLLFTAMLATPGSATPFVIAASARPERLWDTPADPVLAQRIAATGTDPAMISVADAGTVIGAFLDHFRNDDDVGYDGPLGPRRKASCAFLGELVAPWLL